MPDSQSKAEQSPATDARFEPTGWTVVLAAAANLDSPEASAAMEALCRIYWRPVYAFLRRAGHSPHDSEDLVQDFFTFLLEKNALTRVQRAKGKFRSFLLAALQNYLSDARDKTAAAKRGGGVKLLSLDYQHEENQYRLEPEDHQDPERLYHRSWAQTLMATVLAELEAGYIATGKGRVYAEVSRFLFEKKADVSRPEVARRLGIEVATVDVEVHRLKKQLGQFLRQRVAQTVGSRAELEEELRQLFDAFRA